ncbi:MAG: TMEM43 family protein, partial [Mariniblastus sp.]
VPVPPTGTYFGKYDGARGVPHQAVARGGLIDDLIRDTGVLHHIVGGEREVALVTMKEHITKLKWTIRIAGLVGTSFGFLILFSSVVGFLYHIPVIGYFAERGVFIVSVLLGLIVSLITIGMSYLINHPVILVISLFAFVAAFLLLRNKAFASQQRMKERVDRDVGHRVNTEELAELQFVQLLRLANADQNVDIEERKYLKKWAKRHRWSKEKLAELVERANSSEKVDSSSGQAGEQLRALIRLALADGQLHRYEFNAINDAARQFGYSSSELAKTIREVKAEA